MCIFCSCFWPKKRVILQIFGLGSRSTISGWQDWTIYLYTIYILRVQGPMALFPRDHLNIHEFLDQLIFKYVCMHTCTTACMHIVHAYLG